MDLISKVVVDTEWGPQIVADVSGPPGTGAAMMQLLKPRISVYLAGAADPIVLSPYGDPGVTKWPFVQFAMLAGAALGALFLVRKLLP